MLFVAAEGTAGAFSPHKMFVSLAIKNVTRFNTAIRVNRYQSSSKDWCRVCVCVCETWLNRADFYTSRLEKGAFIRVLLRLTRKFIHIRWSFKTWTAVAKWSASAVSMSTGRLCTECGTRSAIALSWSSCSLTGVQLTQMTYVKYFSAHIGLCSVDSRGLAVASCHTIESERGRRSGWLGR